MVSTYDARKILTFVIFRHRNVAVWVLRDIPTSKSTFRFHKIAIFHPCSRPRFRHRLCAT